MDVNMDTRTIVIDSTDSVPIRRRPARLPERLTQRWGIALAGADAILVTLLALIPLSQAPSAVAASIFVAVAICASGWLCGSYTRSYAVTAHDEAYYACMYVAFAAVPIAVILAAISHIPMGLIIVALLLSALGLSILRVSLHLQRRNGAPLRATLSSITPQGWRNRESVSYRFWKRVFDVAGAIVGILVFSPVMLVAAIVILFVSGPPVMFRQRRVGENGEPFTMFKFRTMRKGAGEDWAKRDDERVLRLGAMLRRYSIDELPQFFNVLRGDMSIVGPRPEMVDFVDSFVKVVPNYGQRHVATPGITGWGQLYYNRWHTPGDTPELLQYDLFYVENVSFVLDFALVLKTLGEVLFHRAV
jgi:lipopolysaccharide/colanic/teichoic acid biosynthesis glycosyltransferase